MSVERPRTSNVAAPASPTTRSPLTVSARKSPDGSRAPSISTSPLTVWARTPTRCGALTARSPLTDSARTKSESSPRRRPSPDTVLNRTTPPPSTSERSPDTVWKRCSPTRPRAVMSPLTVCSRSSVPCGTSICTVSSTSPWPVRRRGRAPMTP